MGSSEYLLTGSGTTAIHANYMHVESNSHFWTDLNQLITYLGYIQDSGNQWYDNAWKAEIEQIIIGLKNTIKNGYEIKKTSGIVNLESYFSCIQDMIDVVEQVDISPDYNANEFLKDFIMAIENTITIGYNLTNGLKMERQEIYNRIDGERNYQDATWGSRRQMDGTPDEEKPVAEWINYIEYHVNKAKDKVYHLDTEGATDELRKVAALAVRAMEIHGCPARQIEAGDSTKPTKLDYNPNEDNCMTWNPLMGTTPEEQAKEKFDNSDSKK